jgi:nicotinate-nucleotide pyrophosphorylase (carboxylating)
MLGILEVYVMKRKDALRAAFQRGHLLNLRNDFYRNWIKRFIIEEVRGDTGIKGDITSNALFNGDKTKAEAIVRSRSDGMVAGIEESSFLYRSNNITVKQLKKDGQKIRRGDIILKLKGDKKALLRIERSASDMLERMSGIATLTSQLIRKIKKRAAIAPTRKTQWRYLDKKACYVGGGLTHRLALWDAILIKDNHLRLLRKQTDDTIELALEKAGKKKDTSFIEIEVFDKEGALRAARKFCQLKSSDSPPCLIMFDNMGIAEIRKTIREMKQNKLYRSILLEASGGISPDNIIGYAHTGVDVLSLGYLTNSSKALNIKQQII